MDVLSPCDDAFLKNHNIEKGGMNLIDEARALSLYEAMPEPTQQSGGSAANTALPVLEGAPPLQGRLQQTAFIDKMALPLHAR